MNSYKNIIVALELDGASDEQVLKKARELKSTFGANLYFIHSVEHIASYGSAYGVAAGVDIEEVLMEEAQKAMTQIAEKFAVDAAHQVVKFGPAKQVILEQAKKLPADLIVLGSHGKHGVRLLLGSTANAVLHGAHCDVLAVRVFES